MVALRLWERVFPPRGGTDCAEKGRPTERALDGATAWPGGLMEVAKLPKLPETFNGTFFPACLAIAYYIMKKSSLKVKFGGEAHLEKITDHSFISQFYSNSHPALVAVAGGNAGRPVPEPAEPAGAGRRPSGRGAQSPRELHLPVLCPQAGSGLWASGRDSDGAGSTSQSLRLGAVALAAGATPWDRDGRLGLSSLRSDGTSVPSFGDDGPVKLAAGPTEAGQACRGPGAGRGQVGGAAEGLRGARPVPLAGMDWGRASHLPAPSLPAGAGGWGGGSPPWRPLQFRCG